MVIRRFPAALAIGFVALVSVVGACSSDDGGGSSSTSEYCDAVKGSYEAAGKFVAGTDDSSTPGEWVDYMSQVMDMAPPNVARQYGASLAGDEYAQDDVDLYNRETTSTVP
jgi:hypothetical protein